MDLQYSIKESEIITNLEKYILRNTTNIEYSILERLIINYFKENPSIKMFRTVRRDLSLLRSNTTNLLTAQIEKTIKEYDKLINYQKVQGEDITGALKLKTLLLKYLKEIKIDKVEYKTKTNEEKNLKEIFLFYCKQQASLGKKFTFDSFNYRLTTMTIGEFIKFVRDFSIPLSLTKLKEIFKKTASYSKDLSWDSFKLALIKVADEFFESKILHLSKQQHESTDEEIKLSIGKKIKELKNKTVENRINHLYEYLGLSSIEKYKKKMIGMLLPFNIRDKESRIPPDDLSKKYKIRPLRFVNKDRPRPDPRILVNTIRANKEKTNSLNIAKKFNTDKGQVNLNTTPNVNQKESSKAKLKNKLTFTWKLLNKISYAKLNEDKKNTFNPNDFIINDDSDSEVIERLQDNYNLNVHKHENKDKNSKNNKSHLKKNFNTVMQHVSIDKQTHNFPSKIKKRMNHNSIINNTIFKRNASHDILKNELLDRVHRAENKKKERIGKVTLVLIFRVMLTY